VNLETHLRAARDSGRKLLIPFVTGGLGSQWLDVLRAEADGGADAIEIGIPFSDPVIDGPTIQEASQRALDIGATPRSILNDLQSADVGVPLVVMTYYNPVLHFGHERFAAQLAASSVDGCLIADLPLDELGDWASAADKHNVEKVLLAAPTSSDERLAAICERSQGFVYGISLLGVTGERDSLSKHALEMARRLKAITDKPVIIGIGVSTIAQAVEACTVADGVVLASAIMRRLLDGGTAADVGAFVGELRRALDAG
jgi:tryptophan synthase alpha chain